MATVTSRHLLRRPATMPQHKSRHSHGFTALELLVVIGIMAILSALAAPSFKTLIDRWRILQVVDAMKMTMFYARSEAIKRSSDVFIGKIPNSASTQCTTANTKSDWDCGWVIYIDANSNSKWDAGEEIQRFDTPGNITVTRTTSSDTIRVDRWGMMNGANLIGFTFAPSEGISSPATKGLCMAAGGRIRVINQTEVPCS
ncbi:GspH/FimT family pseudopilin [Paracidovorax wautersii]|uniref:GspH/FimT family pseudopilin n=1 Tax=Paracidovorax wautersii TaxID=1177982 RepID=UPI001FE3787C|nr:GspH/FimT family pseudopilin [Paracidovorax wautersii]